MSRKSAAVGTGEICFRPLVDMTVQVQIPRGRYVSTARRAAWLAVWSTFWEVGRKNLD